MPARAAGFTLIELLIVLAVVAILTAIAVASYNFAMVKARRSAAASCLSEQAQVMERFYTTNMTYVGAPGVATLACNDPNGDVRPFYTLAVPASAATTFTLTATPTAAQNDSRCGTLSLDQIGTRGETGTGTVADCW